MEKLRVFECFSGVGSQNMGLRDIGVDYEVVATADIDKWAIISYAAIHNDLDSHIGEIKRDKEWKKEVSERMRAKGIKPPRSYKKLKWLEIADKLSKNLGDISKINTGDIPDHDLFTFSFPCQDISLAGNQKGLKEDSGTRSSLLWECKKVIEAKKPKYLLLENVKNLIGKNHKENFDKWLEWLESQGYTNKWKVLNAKDYGVPQNRERVFVVSYRDDMDFEFPKKQELKLRLKDVLEKNVDESFYYDGDRLPKLIDKINKKGLSKGKLESTKRLGGLFDKKGKTHQAGSTWDTNGLSPVIDTMQGGYREPMICEERSDEGLRFFKDNVSGTIRTIDSGGDKRIIESKIANVPTSREYHGFREESPTLCARDYKDPKTILEIQKEIYKIRRVTPRECWRLMGFTDEDFDKAAKFMSNSQLYKQAGNSIVVPVLESIFKNMFKKGE